VRHAAGAAGHEAVILAAGSGSRLRAVAPVKPLVPVGGRPLLLRVLDSLAAAGVGRATIVTGHGAAEVEEAVAGRAPLPLAFRHNPDWAVAPQGRSLLAARDCVRPGTLLLMGDHLVAPRLVALLLAEPAAPLLLAVDRRLGHPFVDEADVTRVRTMGRGSRRPIAAIGKWLLVYDALDTGAFRIGPELVALLGQEPDLTLSEAVGRLAARGMAEALDIGDAPWLDIDDARALALASAHWRAICA
jgi:1L-myo-inositol 1-phosphate cytidylyltransferase